MSYLLAILLINLFVLLLCSLLAIAGRLLQQSGRVLLKVNERESEVDCGQTLLASMAQQGTFLPAACGGKGTCGRCQVKIEMGGGHPTALERLQLTPAQIAALMRLACQVRVREDIRVMVAAELMTARAYRARLLRSEPAGPDIRLLSFALDADQRLEFLPGQYMQVVFNQPWERVLRAYSISSAPSLQNEFSLDVQRIDGGLVSTYLHELQPGSVIEVTGPFGEMTLQPQHHETTLVLVAGGVGLAPIRSMIAQLQQHGFKSPVLLFHGARSRENLYFESYFRDLARNFANFCYFPALSQPMLEDGWTGQKGMIHQILELQLQSMPISEPGAAAFICGPAPMMQAVTKVLVAKGLASDRIMTDPFDFNI
jgi:Na+-transporting NADH:ubiquinone oxidoreductase subunit F